MESIFYTCLSYVFHPEELSVQIISCDRTLSEIAKSQYSLGFTVGVLSLIDSKVHHDGKNLSDDEYAFKVASLQKISASQNFFLVAQNQKERLTGLARDLGYKMRIVTTDDLFGESRINSSHQFSPNPISLLSCRKSILVCSHMTSMKLCGISSEHSRLEKTGRTV